MKKPKSKSFIFKAGVLVVAFALVVLCFPVNAVLALAEDFKTVDLSYMTISSDATAGTLTKVVNRGATYTIPKAYIGGKILIDGKTGITGSDDSNTPNEKLVSSSVKVQYGGVGADLLGGSDKSSFVAERVGTYVVTYSYTYKADEKTQYTNTYQLKVECVLSSAAFNFVDNTAVMPSKIDLSLKGAEVEGNDAANVTENREGPNQGEKTYRDVEIALPEVKDENGEIVKDVKFVTSIPQDNTTEKFVLISVNGGTSVPSKNEETEKLTVYEKNGKFYLDGDDFKDDRFGAGKYTVKYAYFIRNKEGSNLGAAQFVTSTTKEIQVYSKNDPHYVDGKYTLELQLASDWVDNGETGVEKTLPKAKGVTSATSSPANEEVEVSYKVEVQYRAKDGVYGALDAEKYNNSKKDTDAEGGFKKIVDVQDEKSYLVDPTAFKPLDDGSYRFIYTITDFYGNTVTSSSGAYEYLNIIDEQDPTPIVYDASVTRSEDEKLEDESYKLKTNAPSNGVIVYAIGIDDNVSGAEDSTLQREIRTSESVSKYTITDYNDKNLVFNYRKTSSNEAWKNLLTNNYLLRKQVEAYNKEHSSEEIDTDAEMLTYLKEHGYLIVVDKANVGHIYGLFTDIIQAKEITDAEVPEGETDTNGNKKAANFLKWLQDKYSDTKTDGSKKTDEELANDRKEITDLGFAYIDSDQTFGATSADGGMGATTYYIHYIATDKQGNKADKSYEMNIGGETISDGERPEVKFGTTLQDSYNPDLTITFDAPTATDNSSDKNMKVRTFYRFLSADGTAVTKDRQNGELVKGGAYENLDDVFAELKDDDGATADEKALAKEFKPYHTGGENVGYIELKEGDAGKYSIDLSKVATTATQLQIFAYTYDDAGNVGLYGETIKINNAADSIAPQYQPVEQDYTQAVEQGETVAIPEVMVYDDNVAYMNYDLKVYYYGKDGVVEIPTSGATSSRKNLGNGAGEYHVYGGKFIASFEGKYTVSVTLYDSRNNSVSYFFNYSAKGKVVVKQPSISATLAKNQTIELDGDANYDPQKGIAIPTPTVNYDIPNSVTYDEYTSAGYVEDTADVPSDLYVVRGVDKNGKATNWSTEGQEGTFKPTEIGTKQIQYTVNLEVYNRTMFAYKEMALDEHTKLYAGGYFVKYTDKDNSAPTLKIIPLSENEIAFENNSKNYLLVRELNPDWTVGGNAEKYVYKLFNYVNKAKGAEITVESDKPDVAKTDGEAFGWFGSIFAYTLESDVYTINVKDTIGPKIQEMDYSNEKYTVDEFKKHVGNPSDNNEVDDEKGLEVLGIEATDASGIDWDKSEIVLSWKLANGVSSSHTYKGADVVTKTNKFKPTTANLVDGTYTVTYTVYDNNGNSSTATYTIARVGDVVQPTIEVKEGLIQSSYQVGQGTKLRIDPAKDLTFKDNITTAEDLAKTLKITLTNTAGKVEANQELLDSEGVYEFTLDELGSYTLTVEIEDAVGNKQTYTRTFDVVAQEVEATNVYQTVGTVLIVISVLVLAGVIVYFIVSKVRLDKELKK